MIASEVRPSTLAGLLKARAAESPDREAYVFLAEDGCESERLTWSELDARARAIARALRHCVDPGERALLLDEVTAHLDPRRRSELLAVLGELGAQCWLTGTEARLFDALARSAHFFHVVDGALTPHE